MKKGFEDFDGYDDENTRIASVCLGITLFVDVPVSKYSKGALKAFTRYREIAGENALTVYATDTMKKHKPVTKRALMLLDTWLAPNAPPRDTISVEYTDADPYFAAPRRAFKIAGEELPDAAEIWPSVLRISFDRSWGVERYEEVVQFVLQLTEWIPIRSGYSGFALEYSRYSREEGCEYAWKQSMRHPGLEIHSCIPTERFATLKDSIRTTSWLTLIDNEFINELGGLKALKKRLPGPAKIVGFEGGILIRVGKTPAVGDVNRNDKLPDYRAVYRALRPLTDKAVERTKWLELAEKVGERTERWLRRWDDA